MKVLVFNKPFRVMSQFSSEGEKTTLKAYIKDRTVYPAGRLDYDSEGLMLLTNDGKLQAQISSPKFKMPKTYWVQIEGTITQAALDQLASGVHLKDGMTAPAGAQLISEPKIWTREPPIRQRKNIPTSWIELVITEGKNRQVRRMTAAVGYPTLRLIRAKIGPYTLQNLMPGESRWDEVRDLPSLRHTAQTSRSYRNKRK